MTDASEAAIEAEIKAKNKTAPRLTPEHIEDQIVAEYFGRASDLFDHCPGVDALETLTIAVLVLKNGFAVVGESACASPENFDKDIGRKLARENARKQIWRLEGYALCSSLREGKKE